MDTITVDDTSPMAGTFTFIAYRKGGVGVSDRLSVYCTAAEACVARLQAFERAEAQRAAVKDTFTGMWCPRCLMPSIIVVPLNSLTPQGDNHNGSVRLLHRMPRLPTMNHGAHHQTCCTST